jgi:hypothetical protein
MASVWGNVSDWRAPVWKICKKSDGVLHSFWKFRNFPPPLPHSCWPIPIPPPVILAPPSWYLLTSPPTRRHPPHPATSYPSLLFTIVARGCAIVASGAVMVFAGVCVHAQ